MGGWQLEVCKMWLYMSFPVSLYYIFNRPEIFEESVRKTRQEWWPPITADTLYLQKEIAALKKQRELEKLADLKAQDEN